MAIVSKDKLYELWNKFQSSPNSLNVDEYKTIQDTVQSLVRNGNLSKSEGENMLSGVRGYC